METQTMQPARPPRPRLYNARIIFEGQRATPVFEVKAFSFMGALAKLAGAVSDQSLTVVGVELALAKQKLILDPSSPGFDATRPGEMPINGLRFPLKGGL